MGEGTTDETQRVVAIILGAGTYPHSPALNSPQLTQAFVSSKQGVHAYLTGISETVLDLFDDRRNPSDIGLEIHRFLNAHRDATDVIVFYVGHGGFLADQSYYVALASTDTTAKSFTVLKVADLAETLREHPGRVYLILDCCFSGAAVKSFFQGTEAELVATQTKKLPRGVAVLAASSQDEAAITPTGSSYTMFSEAILSAWSNGSPTSGERISLKQLGDIVSEGVQTKYAGVAVRPQVQSPIQRDGDPADYPLFSNPGWKGAGRSPALLSFLASCELQTFIECRVSPSTAGSDNPTSIKDLRRTVQRAVDAMASGPKLTWLKNSPRTVAATSDAPPFFVRLVAAGGVEAAVGVGSSSEGSPVIDVEALVATIKDVLTLVVKTQDSKAGGAIAIDCTLHGSRGLEVRRGEKRYRSDEESIQYSAKMGRKELIDRRAEWASAISDEILALYNIDDLPDPVVEAGVEPPPPKPKPPSRNEETKPQSKRLERRLARGEPAAPREASNPFRNRTWAMIGSGIVATLALAYLVGHSSKPVETTLPTTELSPINAADAAVASTEPLAQPPPPPLSAGASTASPLSVASPTTAALVRPTPTITTRSSSSATASESICDIDPSACAPAPGVASTVTGGSSGWPHPLTDDEWRTLGGVTLLSRLEDLRNAQASEAHLASLVRGSTEWTNAVTTTRDEYDRAKAKAVIDLTGLVRSQLDPRVDPNPPRFDPLRHYRDEAAAGTNRMKSLLAH